MPPGVVRSRSSWTLVSLTAAALVVAPGLASTGPGSRVTPVARTPTATPPPPSPLALESVHTAAAELPRLHALIVSSRGQILLERYFRGAGPHKLANVKSVSKSVISALVGIAIERKFLSGVDQPIGSFFPRELRGDAAAPKRAITVEDLLTMRSGLESTSSRNYGAWVRSANWVRYVLARPLVSEPGRSMDYSTGSSHLLSAILTKASGRSTWQFAQEALARPLGFSLARWPQDPQGVYFGGNEMLLTPRQMLAFGELYLNRGRANGKQIVPEAWIDASFVPRGRSRWGNDREYGYGWWMREAAGQPVYYAWGYGGQFIFLVPDARLVVVTTSSSAAGSERREHLRAVYDLVERLVGEGSQAPF